MTLLSIMDEKRWWRGRGTLYNTYNISVDPITDFDFKTKLQSLLLPSFLPFSRLIF